MKKLFSIKYTDNGIAFATFLLRLALGGLIIPHGYSKLITFASKSSSFADPFHIGHSTSMALVIFAEFFCGVFYFIGIVYPAGLYSANYYYGCSPVLCT